MVTETIAPAIVGIAKPQQAGFAGFICEVSGEPVPPADCLACAQAGAPGCPMTPALVERILASLRPVEFSQKQAEIARSDFGISVTELVGCPRKFRLRGEYPYYERPSALAAAHRGAARHADLALYSGPGVVEFRLSWTFVLALPGGERRRVTITGQPDLIILRESGWWLVDYKDTNNPPKPTYRYYCRAHPDILAGQPTWRGRGPFFCPQCGQLERSQVDEYVLPPAARPQHALQINLLALLVQKNAGILAKRFNALRLERQWDVPAAPENAPVVGGEVAYLGALRCQVALDAEQAVAFIKERLAALLAPELPPPIQEETWQCDYCPVQQICKEVV